MARKSVLTIVTNKKDGEFLEVFDTFDKAMAFVGPDYDKQGFIVRVFEKQTRTSFVDISDKILTTEPEEKAAPERSGDAETFADEADDYTE